MSTLTIVDQTGSISLARDGADVVIAVQDQTQPSVLTVAAPGPQGIQGPVGAVTQQLTDMVTQAQNYAQQAQQATSGYDPIPITVNPQNLGTTDAANAIIMLTGVLTAPQVVNLPASTSRAMIVANGTTGKFPLTFGMQGGAVSVPIPQGKAVQIYCDGTTGVYAVAAIAGLQFSGAKNVSVTNTALDSTYAGAYTTLSGAGMSTALPLGSTMQPGGSVFLDATGTGTQTITPATGDTADFGASMALKQGDKFLYTWNGTSWRTTCYGNWQAPHFSTSATAPLLFATSRAIIGGGADNGSTALQVTGGGSFTITPTFPTMPANDNSLSGANTAYVQAAIAALVASAPGTLNTLNELATALGDDPNFATTVTNSIATKLPLAGGTLTGLLSIAYANAELRWKDTSQSLPNGLFRFISTGNTFVLQRNTVAAGDFSGNSALLTFNASNVPAFAVRPTFNGNLAWDAGNLTPGNYMPLSGGTFSGAVSFTGTTTFSNTNTFTGATGFSARPTFNGATPWDSANLTPSNYLPLGGGTMTGALSLSFAAAYVSINAAAAGQQSRVNFTTNGSARWGIGKNSDAESGSNVGSSFFINRYDDTGTLVDSAVSIARATGIMSLTARPVFAGNLAWDAGNLNPANFVSTAGAVTFGGQTTVAYSGATSMLNDTSGTSQFGFGYQSNGSPVWAMWTGVSGGAASRQWMLQRYVSGAAVDNPIAVSNSTGQTTFSVRPAFGASTPWDSGNLTPGNYLTLGGGTMTGNLTLSYASPAIYLNAPTVQNRLLSFQTGTVNRWQVGADATAETGSNVGSNFVISRMNDAGAYQDEPFGITRSTGQAWFTQRPVFNGQTPWDAANFNPANYAPLAGATFTGDVWVSKGAVNSYFVLNSNAGQYRGLNWKTASVSRWEMGVSNDAETGGNAGSNWYLSRYSDTGNTWVDNPIFISRASGLLSFNWFNTNALSAPGAATGVGSTTGGSLAAATYYVKVCAVDGLGAVTPVGAESAAVTTTGTTSSIAYTWASVPRASSYRVYYGTAAGAENAYFTTNTNSFTLTATNGTAGTPPTVNRTAGANIFGRLLIGGAADDGSTMLNVTGSGAFSGNAYVNGGTLGLTAAAQYASIMFSASAAAYTPQFRANGTAKVFEWVNSANTQVIATLADSSANLGAALTLGSVAATVLDNGTSGGQFRAVNTSYGVMIRNDNSTCYFLSTASGSPYGTWNAFRPFFWNLASGAVTVDGSGAGTTFGGGITMNGGTFVTAPIAANDANGQTTASIQVRNNSGTGDANVAAISFLCQGSYGRLLHLRADGYFGTGGWSAAAWQWYVSPSGDMVAAGNVSAYSDPRLKERFERIKRPMDILKKLDGGTFYWREGFKHTEGKAGRRDYGVLADQVEAVMPEIVSESVDIEGESYRTVAYEKLVPVLIEAIKDLERKYTREIRGLKKRVAELEKAA